MTDPMTDYRLAEIREEDASAGSWVDIWANDNRPAYRATAHRRELLAEIDRLREERGDLKRSYLAGLAKLRAEYEAKSWPNS